MPPALRRGAVGFYPTFSPVPIGVLFWISADWWFVFCGPFDELWRALRIFSGQWLLGARTFLGPLLALGVAIAWCLGVMGLGGGFGKGYRMAG